MALEIKQLDPQAQMHVVTAEERLWLTADRDRLVPEGHEDAAFLYCAVGQQIPADDAARYGLVKGYSAPTESGGDRDDHDASPEDGDKSGQDAAAQQDGSNGDDAPNGDETAEEPSPKKRAAKKQSK